MALVDSGAGQAIADVLRGARVVDLTLTLDEAYPCAGAWLPPFRHVIYNWYEPRPDDPQPLLSRRYAQPGPDGTQREGVFYGCWMTLYEHSGTHFDAPTHSIPPSASGLPLASEWGDVYGDMVPLEKFQGPAAVVDVRHLRQGPQRPGVSPAITAEVLQAWEREHGAFGAGDVVILQTGWDEFFLPYPDADKYVTDPFQGRSPAWPAPTVEAVNYVADRGVQLLATDTPSLGGADDIYSTHNVGLGRGMVFVECLAHLDQLPPRGSYFLFLAPKITKSSGCTGRAVAWVPRPR